MVLVAGPFVEYGAQLCLQSQSGLSHSTAIEQDHPLQTGAGQHICVQTAGLHQPTPVR